MEPDDEYLREAFITGRSNTAETVVPPHTSRLDELTVNFVNRQLYAVPYEGWGWRIHHNDSYDQGIEIRPPHPLELQIEEFFDWNDRRRGAIARVTAEGAKACKVWGLLYLYPREGVYDFERNIASYYIHLGQNRPSLYAPSQDPQFGARWPLVKFGDCERRSGMAIIAASLETARSVLAFEE